jgi:hypothetical protein
MRKRVGLKSVAHNELAIAMKKLGKKTENVNLKPIVTDLKGKAIKKQ